MITPIAHEGTQGFNSPTRCLRYNFDAWNFLVDFSEFYYVAYSGVFLMLRKTAVREVYLVQFPFTHNNGI